MTENARIEAQNVVLRRRCQHLVRHMVNVQKARSLESAKKWAMLAIEADFTFDHCDEALADAPVSEEST